MAGDQPAPRVRLFVAADLPDDVRAALAAWRPSDGALRPVAPEYLHVTLCFLGSVAESLVEPVGAATVACAAPVGPLAVGGGLWLPPRRPRVLAVALEDPEVGSARCRPRCHRRWSAWPATGRRCGRSCRT